jgi:uncharacterized membrane protein
MGENKNIDKETLERWHKDPKNWIWGLFYYNKFDPRLLPPKRIAAMGWTVNFANPKSLFFMVGILVVVFMVIGAFSK